MKFRVLFFLATAFFFGLSFTGEKLGAQVLAPKGAQLVAASLASVDGQMISSRDVEVSMELQKSLGKFRTMDFAVELDALSQALLNSLAAREAKSFQMAQVEEEEIKQGLLKLRSSEVIRNAGLKDTEVRALISEKILAEKFLELRSEGLRTVVTDQEIRDYFERNRANYRGMPFDKFKETVRKDLETENRQKRFLEWFDVLKQKYKVRIYGSPDPASRSKRER